ncbi:MAG: hypothetical protein HYY23_16800, partial [Verrucomicrobia bacterium]|nr:hypothetical protein [Verrucomicrobiota bacterium]
MNESTNLGPIYPRDGSVTAPEQNGSHGRVDAAPRLLPARPAAVHPHESAAASPADFAAVIEATLRKWPWWLGAGLIFAAAGMLWGMQRWETRYSARGQLYINDASHVLDVFRPKPYLAQSLPKLIQSPDVLRRVSEQTQPPVSPNELAYYLKVVPERNGEFVTIAFSATTPARAVEVINVFATNAIVYAKDLQKEEALELKQFIEAQVKQSEADLTLLTNRMQAILEKQPLLIGTNVSLSARTRLVLSLEAARAELSKLLEKLLPTHPKVEAQQAIVDSYEEQLAKVSESSPGNSKSTPTIPLSGDPKSSTETETPALPESGLNQNLEVVRGQIQQLESTKISLQGRANAADAFAKNPVGYYRLYAAARLENVLTHGRNMKVILMALFSGVIGMGLAAVLILLLEVVDDRLKTREDVHRVTGLPVLASIGDLSKLDESVRAHLAFRAWISMKKRFTESSNGGIVCGLIGSNPDAAETSTWLQLLGHAANQCGHRALTIAAGWPEESPESNGKATGKPGETTHVGPPLVSRTSDLLA